METIQVFIIGLLLAMIYSAAMWSIRQTRTQMLLFTAQSLIAVSLESVDKVIKEVGNEIRPAMAGNIICLVLAATQLYHLAEAPLDLLYWNMVLPIVYFLNVDVADLNVRVYWLLKFLPAIPILVMVYCAYTLKSQPVWWLIIMFTVLIYIPFNYFVSDRLILTGIYDFIIAAIMICMGLIARKQNANIAATVQ